MIRGIPSLMVAAYRATTFIPSSIAGLKFWAAANDLSLSDNDPVSTWFDKSGNGNNVTASLVARPTYKTNIQNGLPILRFDGVANVLAGIFTITYGTVFVVCNFNSAGNFPNYNGLIITEAGGVGSDDFFDGDGSGSTNMYATGGPFGAANIYVNGVNTLQFAPLTTMKLLSGIDNTPISKTSLNIGNDPAAALRFWNGDICEVLIYDSALSPTDRGNVETYLNSKWALLF